MVWHPEIETLLTRSQLGRSPAVWPRPACTSGSLGCFLCQTAMTLAAESWLQSLWHLLGTGSVSAPKLPLFTHHVWPVRPEVRHFMISASLGHKPSLPSLSHHSFPKTDSPASPSSGQGPLPQKRTGGPCTSDPLQSRLPRDPPPRGLSVHIRPCWSDLSHRDRSAVPASTVCTLFPAQVCSLASRVSPPGGRLPLQGTPRLGRAAAGPGVGVQRPLS